MRVLVVTPIPTPYRDPFWEACSRLPDIDLSVIYCAAVKSDRPWGSNDAQFGYQRLFPSGRNLLSWFGWGRSCYWNGEVSSLLREIKPDVVLVGGYNHLTMLNSIRHCHRHRVPWLMMSESWKSRGGIVGAVKHIWLRRLLRSASGALPTGSLASTHLCRLGIPKERQCLLPNVPDIAAIRSKATDLQRNRGSVKTALGADPTGQLIVFAARMISKKRPLAVVEAFSRLDSTETVELVMIGDGPLLASAKQLAADRGCADRVLFPGFINPEDVHRWMAVADLFVQPSSETWGVAPIEALACGLPVILTPDIGCHADVLQDASDGTVVSPDDIPSLSAAMQLYLLDSREPRLRLNIDDAWIFQNRYEDVAARLRTSLLKFTNASHAAVL